MANEIVPHDSALSSDEQEMIRLWPLLSPTAKKIVLDAARKESEPASIDEVKMRRVLAILEKTFGPVEGARPTLRLVDNNAAAPASQADKQAKKRRLLTQLEQEFGPVAVGARPKPRVIEGGRSTHKVGISRSDEMVCRLKAIAREKWPESYGARPKLRVIQGGRQA